MAVSRRAFLTSLTLGAAGAAACAVNRPPASPSTPAGQPPLATLVAPEVEAGALTPLSDFYVRCYQRKFEGVTRDAWQLDVYDQSSDRAQITLKWADMLGLPQVEQAHTLECIGNPVGGNKIGNQLWRGVRLRDVLAQFPIASARDHVVFSGADDYFTSVPLELALDERSLIALAVADRDLPSTHGFPARALLPGVYGQKQPKWLVGLRTVTGYQPGTWERKGWSDTARIQINSRIDFPHDGAQLPAGQPLAISGIAFADDTGVAHVEVSLDAGASWAEAELLPGPSPMVWTAWRWVWPHPLAGAYTLKVRATSGQGQTQVDEGGLLTNVFPDGTTSMHSVRVNVA